MHSNTHNIDYNWAMGAGEYGWRAMVNEYGSCYMFKLSRIHMYMYSIRRNKSYNNIQSYVTTYMWKKML